MRMCPIDFRVQRWRSQCTDYWKWFTSHDCFSLYTYHHETSHKDSKFKVTGFLKSSYHSWYDILGLAHMNVLFWGQRDFLISFSYRYVLRNAWNRHWGSHVVDSGDLINHNVVLDFTTQQAKERDIRLIVLAFDIELHLRFRSRTTLLQPVSWPRPFHPRVSNRSNELCSYH